MTLATLMLKVMFLRYCAWSTRMRNFDITLVPFLLLHPLTTQGCHRTTPGDPTVCVCALVRRFMRVCCLAPQCPSLVCRRIPPCVGSDWRFRQAVVRVPNSCTLFWHKVTKLKRRNCRALRSNE